MKFIHLSDLHLGKRVNAFSMIDDQKDIVKKILKVIKEEKPDAVLIAGDIYDKPVPSVEAVELFDDFLKQLSRQKLQVFIISGNHDSPERMAFAAELIEASGIHIAPVYGGKVEPVSLRDAYGTVNIYMLPFIKPVHVRSVFPEEKAESYTEALDVAISHMEVDKEERNILLTHQFVTGAVRSESEEISVGGSDNVDASVFSAFDYVALGHIHGPQHVGRETIRYCGTPLKYSFSEAEQHKSVTVVELGEKGQVGISTVPLIPLHDMRRIRGTYLEVTARSFYQDMDTEDYVQITLTDEEDIPDGLQKLRIIYPNLMRLEYDNSRTKQNRFIECAEETRQKSELELFAEFYELQNNRPMSGEQSAFAAQLIGECKEL